jgi:hypothetical protein
MTRLMAAALLALLLSACGWGESKKTGGAGTAQGEVLPGSVSDAMIPLDSVKSQAPLAPKVDGADKQVAKAPDKAKTDPVAKPAAEPDPAEAEPAAAE